MGVRMTFLGGAAELGGNIFLLEDNGVRFFLDFGVNFDRLGQFYRFPIGPRKYRALKTHLELGLYPYMPGIYRQDYLQQMYRDPEFKEFMFSVHKKPSVDAVVFSHAHIDHCAGLHFLDPTIPSYMSRLSKLVMVNMAEAGGMPFNEFVDHTFYKAEAEKIREYGTKRLIGAEAATVTAERNIRLIEHKKTFSIGHVGITPYNVDHSLPGAMAFIIHSSIGNIVFTGDIRLRGRHREWTEEFVQAAREAKPRYVLSEGSLIHKIHAGTEKSLEHAVVKFLRKRKGLVMTSYPPRDFDRIQTMYKIANRLNRKLVIDTRQANLIDKLNGVLGLPKINSGVLRLYDREKEMYNTWEKQYLFKRGKVGDRKTKTITAEEINAHPEQYIFFLQATSTDELLKVRPPDDSVYFRSHPEPYTDEMEIDQRILVSWLKRCRVEFFSESPLLDGDLDYQVMQAHVTGHMSEEEKQWMIDEMFAETEHGILIPIHVLEEERHRFNKMYDGEIIEANLEDTIEMTEARAA